jgi:hypothetical protein
MTEHINKLAKIHSVLCIEAPAHIQKYITERRITLDTANIEISANDTRLHRYSKCPWCNPNVKIELVDPECDSDSSSDWVPDSQSESSDSSGLDTDSESEEDSDTEAGLAEYFDTMVNLQDYVKSTKL